MHGSIRLKQSPKCFCASTKQFATMAENLSENRVGTLRSDRGGEYMSSEFNVYLAERGIKHQCTVSYTPQQNGVAERKNRSLMEMERCMVKSQALPHGFWLEAVMCATYVLNNCPTKALQSITPYEACMAATSHPLFTCIFFIAWHIICVVRVLKLDDKAVKCIFMTYNFESKSFVCIILKQSTF